MSQLSSFVPTLEIDGKQYTVGEGSFSQSGDKVPYTVISNPRNVVINYVVKTDYGYAASVTHLDVLCDLIQVY